MTDRPARPVGDDDQPALHFTLRNGVTLAGFLFAALAALYFMLPKVAGLEDTWQRIRGGAPRWTGRLSTLTARSGPFRRKLLGLWDDPGGPPCR